MFLYEKRITYLSLIRDGIKEGNVGFVRFTDKHKECQMDLQLRRISDCIDGNYPVYFTTEIGKVPLGELYVQAGAANISRYFKVTEDNIELPEGPIGHKEICGILIRLQKGDYIYGLWREPARQQEEPPEPVGEAETLEEPVKKEAHLCIAAADPGREEENNLSDDKWEQLLKSYTQIHPFGDERIFVSIELKDFIILRTGYQKLVNNSFLLHGFYNYRYLILGPDMELGGREGNCFYIGVPGTYFEREKMVAVMFGFEGFECEGPVEIGKFGYYLRRVEL